MNILVTGGAGYIGSHTVLELLNLGHNVVVVDNLSNSSSESLKRVEKITGKTIRFENFDLANRKKLDLIFKNNSFDVVIHFAGLKSVAESVANPLHYYRNNIDSTLTLCETMAKHNLKNLIFSSSATVYGVPETLPLTEESRIGFGITNPYGQTKFMIEQILQDLYTSDKEWCVTLLRYFNPIGAHESGLIGEDPKGIPNNLLPYISQVAVGKLARLTVYGDDYDTPDGTGVRDYIHVVDLALGHVAAVNKITTQNGVSVYNLGTGKGVSVYELVKAFEEASRKKIPFTVANRRAGDVASCWADCSKAKRGLNWSSKRSTVDACVDTWRWQSQNPNGFK